VTGASVVLAAAAFAWGTTRRAPAAEPAHWPLALEADFKSNTGFPVKPSPDGSKLVYVGRALREQGGGTEWQVQLWVKPRGSDGAIPIPGTADAWNFTFSPDGQWIAFVQGRQLKKVPVAGGAGVTLADSVGEAPGIAWLNDGTLIYVADDGHTLRRVSDAGGASTVLFRADSAAGVREPVALPGGKAILYIASPPIGQSASIANLWVRDLATGTSRHLRDRVVKADYLPTGQLVFASAGGTLYAAPFSVSKLALTGEPIPVADSVKITGFGRDALYDVSPAAGGTLVMRRGASQTRGDDFTMVWVDRAGHEQPADSAWRFNLGGWGQGNVGWALSPDGKRIVIGLATESGDDIWVKQLPAGPATRVTFDSVIVYRPRWSADGRRVTYVRGDALYETSADGTGKPRLLLSSPDQVFEGAWSADGRWIVARTRGGPAARLNRDIVGLHVGDTAARPLVASKYDESGFALSPDGKWIAYESDETGREEIYVRPFPNTDGGKWQVSTSGGVSPLWARNSHELFFVSGAREMTAVAIGSAPPFGQPRPLFRLSQDYHGADAHDPDFYTPFDIGPDGRFLMAKRVRSATVNDEPLILVDNWFTELRRKTARR
jgi:serine/threonine-protein kinase